MNYIDIMVFLLSFLSIFICFFVIWLAIIFYRLYTQFSLTVTEMSKGLDVTTTRLERLPKILFNEELVFPEKSLSYEQVIKNQGKEKNIPESDQRYKIKKEENEKNNQKGQEKKLLKQIVLESEEI